MSALRHLTAGWHFTAQNKISLKNMQTGEQQLLSLVDAANVILEDMRVRNNGKLIKS